MSGHPSPSRDLPVNLAAVGLSVLPIAFLVGAVLLLASGILQVARAGWQSGDRLLHRYLILLGAVILVVTLSHQSASSWWGMFNYLPFLGFFALFSQVTSNPARIRRCLQAIALSSIPVSLLGLGQAIWRWEGRLEVIPVVGVVKMGFVSGRPTSIFTSPNHLAVYLVIVGAIAWGLWMDRSRQSRLETGIQAIAFGLALPLLVVTTSRNGWLIALLGVFVALLVLQRWLWVGVAIAASCVPVLAAFGVPGFRAIVPATIWKRLVDSFVPGTDAYIAAITRWQMWQFARELSLERFWTGWGWQSFYYESPIPPYFEKLTHAHNLPLHIAAEGGWVVTTGLLLLWGWIGWRAWRAWWRDRSAIGFPVLGTCLALTCYWASGAMDAVYLDGRLNTLVWCLLACALSYARASEPNTGTALPYERQNA
ncbi:MAG: O-antigen ligase family protein [Cyanobacteria bacterium J06639_1]